MEKKQSKEKSRSVRKNQQNSQASSFSAKKTEGESNNPAKGAHATKGAAANWADASNNAGIGDSHNKSAPNPVTKEQGGQEPRTPPGKGAEIKDPENSESDGLKQTLVKGNRKRVRGRSQETEKNLPGQNRRTESAPSRGSSPRNKKKGEVVKVNEYLGETTDPAGRLQER